MQPVVLSGFRAGDAAAFDRKLNGLVELEVSLPQSAPRDVHAALAVEHAALLDLKGMMRKLALEQELDGRLFENAFVKGKLSDEEFLSVKSGNALPILRCFLEGAQEYHKKADEFREEPQGSEYVDISVNKEKIVVVMRIAYALTKTDGESFKQLDEFAKADAVFKAVSELKIDASTNSEKRKAKLRKLVKDDEFEPFFMNMVDKECVDLPCTLPNTGAFDADCSETALITKGALKEAGIEVSLISFQYFKEDGKVVEGHIAAAKIDGKLTIIDPAFLEGVYQQPLVPSNNQEALRVEQEGADFLIGNIIECVYEGREGIHKVANVAILELDDQIRGQIEVENWFAENPERRLADSNRERIDQALRYYPLSPKANVLMGEYYAATDKEKTVFHFENAVKGSGGEHNEAAQKYASFVLNNGLEEKYPMAYECIRKTYCHFPKDDRVLGLKLILETRLNLKDELEKTKQKIKELNDVSP